VETEILVQALVELLRRRQRLPISVGAEVYVNLLFLAEHHNPTDKWMLPSSGFVQAWPAVTLLPESWRSQICLLKSMASNLTPLAEQTRHMVAQTKTLLNEQLRKVLKEEGLAVSGVKNELQLRIINRTATLISSI
jgi:hypothetical protein